MSGGNSSNVSPYGKVCQAAHLLGRVIQHINFEHNVKEADSEMHWAEALQLQRAADSFLRDLDNEFQSATSDRRLRLLTAKAIAFSTLMNLFDVAVCTEGDTIRVTDDSMSARIEVQSIAMREQIRIAAEVVHFAREVNHIVAMEGMKVISPLICECYYQAAAYYAWHYRESGNDRSLDSLNSLRQALSSINVRWHVAGEYETRAMCNSTNGAFAGSYIRLLVRTEYEWKGGCRF